MAEQELQIVRLRQDFYRDGFYPIIGVLLVVALAALFLVAVSVYLFFSKPDPVQFVTDNEWRVMASVPIDKPYLREPDLLQWVSEVIPSVFSYDFANYQKQLNKAALYFTPDGWKRFGEVINQYANADTVQNIKMFINATPTGAPSILNQGLLEGKYGWWVTMPLSLKSIIGDRANAQGVKVQALVVRVPTLQNLDGVSIDNIIVTKVQAV